MVSSSSEFVIEPVPPKSLLLTKLSLGKPASKTFPRFKCCISPGERDGRDETDADAAYLKLGVIAKNTAALQRHRGSHAHRALSTPFPAFAST